MTAGMIFASTAMAAGVLDIGRAYCFYWTSTQGQGHSGGMHLVAATTNTIGAGPNNFISGLDGKPQDTVVFVSCNAVAGQSGGFAYVGLPRTTLQMGSGGNFAFAQHEVVHNVRHLESHLTGTMTVSLNMTGTAVNNEIVGKVTMTAPNCLNKPLTMQFTGS
jgi:hypothetical protein